MEDKQMYNIFFHPAEAEGAAADFIPFFSEGTFHLFYLYDHRNPDKHGEGLSWYKITTKDLLHFTDNGIVLPQGELHSPDLYVFTGSVIKTEAAYHIFYTGHNPHLRTYGDHLQCIMHAVSTDLQNWSKIPEDTFYAPDGYDKCDFRDPFVYYDPESRSYFMLLCARPDDGAFIRKGETLQLSSADLKAWNYDRVFYSPQKFHTLECPDLFQIGDWWYLIFSEYTEKHTTCYRMSGHRNGPWIKPKCDTFDGRAYYAAKTASDGKNRFLFGWVPTRQENTDSKPWMWGGNLLVHQLVQKEDGTLGTCIPEYIDRRLQTAFLKHPALRLDTPYSTQVFTLLHETPSAYKLSMECEIGSGYNDSFGILVKRDSASDTSYGFTIDLSEESLYVNTLPCFPQNAFDTYQLRRPLEPGRQYSVELLADNDIFVLYVNHRIALSVRLCSLKGTELAVYASHACVQFSDIQMSTM
jgi:beta-fructofuranosidase